MMPIAKISTMTAIRAPTSIRTMRFCRASLRPKAICFFVFCVVSGAVFRFLDDLAIWSTPF